MNPFDSGVFLKDGPVLPKPAIRLVLAFSSPEAGVVFRKRASHRRHDRLNTFTAFDIWLSGLSTDTFREIGEDLESYEALLECSLRPYDSFELPDFTSRSFNDLSKSEKTSMELKAVCRRMMSLLILTKPGHHEIHRKDAESGRS